MSRLDDSLLDESGALDPEGVGSGGDDVVFLNREPRVSSDVARRLGGGHEDYLSLTQVARSTQYVLDRKGQATREGFSAM